MYIYIILFVVWFIFEFLVLSIKKNNSTEYKEKVQLKFSFILCCILFIVCAFRSYSIKNYIGIDTNNYHVFFTNNIQYESISSLLNSITNDQGYYIFGWILGKINLPFVSVLIAEALLYVGVFYMFLKKYSKEPLLSVLFFVCLLFTFSMSAIRQSMAMGICLLAYMLYDKYKDKKIKSIIIYVLLILLAMSFHKSAIIFAPAIFIPKIKYDKKIIFIFLAIAALTMMFKSQFARLFVTLAGDYSQKYANSYEVTGDNVGTKFYLFVLFFVLLNIIFSKKINRVFNNDNLIYMMLAMVIIFPAVQSGGAMMRVYYYYYMFAPVYMVNTLNCINDKNLRLLAKILIIVFLVYLFFNGNLVGNRLAPYSFSFGEF